MESMGKHPALISQKFLLTLYKKNITKSRKKKKPQSQQNSSPWGGLKAPGGWEMGPPSHLGHGGGTGAPGAVPLPSFTVRHTCSHLSPLTNHDKTAGRGA